MGGDALGLTRDAQRLCEAGSYCVGGVRLACPAGTYNARRGSSEAADCFATEPGSFAPEGSAAATPCPAGTFGAIAGLSQPSCSGPCAPGFYCPAGSTRADAVACPAGRVGAQAGLSSASCSPLCDRATGLCVDALSECPQGSFCGPASAAPLPCGGPSVYCPRGSPAPLPVSAGFYSDGGGARQRACPRGSYCAGGLKMPCPEGTGGESEALQTAACSGPCEAGFYCEQGSPSLFQHRCGHGAFCPEGSWRPNPVAHGWFATGGRDSTMRSAQQPCDAGHYCLDGLKIPCPAGAYAPDAGRDSCLSCPRGHFCPSASVQPQRCPAGTWGGAEGLATPDCSGPCRAGYYCPEGSTSAAQVLCAAGADAAPEEPLPAGAQEGVTYGSATGLTGVRLRDAVFCPPGSSAPQAVLAGHIALGGRQGARTYQAPCAEVSGEWRFDSACDRGEFVPGSLV